MSSTPTTTALAVTSGGSAVTTVPSGTAISLTATVNAGSASVTIGQVNFCDASVTYCTDIHLLGSAQLTSAGTAVFNFIPGIGSHSVKAVYAGTHTNATSSSTPASVTVTHSGLYSSATTLVSSGNPGSYSLTATVAAAPANAPIASTGLISFLDTTNDNRVLGTASLVANAQPLSFTAALNSSSYVTDPSAMVLGDFNGDGKPDLVLNTDYPDARTTVFELGNGDRTFNQLAPLTLAATVVTAGDFNHDGNLDLIELEAGISTLLGNGDGTFQALPSSAPLPVVSAGVAGDFDGDGLLDLAFLEFPYEQVLFLRGNGDGTFAAPSVAAHAKGDQMAVGDFNGDGKLDLVLTSPADNVVRVLLGQGDGTFISAGTNTIPVLGPSIGVGDFNGDGKLDVVVLSHDTSSGSAVLLLGNGDGTLTMSPTTVPCGAANGPLVVSDFNGDGKADLGIVVTASGEDINSVSIFLGAGDGTFTASATAPADPGAVLLVAADFNGDGLSDLATGDMNTGTGPGVQLAQLFASTATVANIAVAGTGTHQVTASYPGDSVYSASVSAAAALTATLSATITFPVAATHTYGDAPFTVAATSVSTGAFTYTVVSGPAMISGATVSLTGTGTVVLQASQAAADGYAAASQTATLTVAQASLSIAANNSARVFGAANPVFTGTVTGAVNGDVFTETFSTDATAASIVGTYSITPAVTGPKLANYVVSPSDGELIISQAGTATTFALSNGNLTLTANVASLTSGMPTGTVAFYEGQSMIGSGAVSNGTASYTASSAPSGDVVVSAQYSGDANFTQSASPPILLLSVAPANTVIIVPQSGSVTNTVNLAAAPGFAGTIQLSCSNLPTHATCSFQPSSVTFSGTTTATSTSVTIQTGVTAQAQLPASPLDLEQAFTGSLAAAFWMPGLLTALSAGRRRKPGSPRRRLFVLLLLLGAASFGVSGCGGGSSSSSTPNPLQTPAGSYTVQVIATGVSGFSQSTSLTLTVQ